MSYVLRSEPVRNTMLRSIPPGEFALLSPCLSRVQLVANQVLNEPGERLEHAFFIEQGIVSLRDMSVPASHVQVAMIGREGLVGCEALLRREEPVMSCAVIQQPGTAIRVPVRDLTAMFKLCPDLTAACMAAVLSLMRQIADTAVSNARDSLAQRCIRLLLMIHDRIEGEEVQITHEALSAMLGVRRSGVTLVATDLQGDGLVRVNRGRITILDRPGLERQIPRNWRGPVRELELERPFRAEIAGPASGSALTQR